MSENNNLGNSSENYSNNNQNQENNLGKTITNKVKQSFQISASNIKISLKELLWKAGFRYLFAGLIVFFIAVFGFLSFEIRGLFGEMFSHLYTAIESNKALINEKHNNLNNLSWQLQEKTITELEKYHTELITEPLNEKRVELIKNTVREILKNYSYTHKIHYIGILNSSGYPVIDYAHSSQPKHAQSQSTHSLNDSQSTTKNYWLDSAKINQDSINQVQFTPVLIPLPEGLVHIVKLPTETNYYLVLVKKMDTSTFAQLRTLEAIRNSASLIIYRFFILTAGIVLMIFLIFILYSRYIVKTLYRKVLQSLQTLLHMANQVSNMEYIEQAPQVAIKEFQNLINVLFHALTYIRQTNASLHTTNKELKLQSALTKAIVENISSGVILLSTQRQILVMNHQAYELLNIEEHEGDTGNINMEQFNIMQILPHIETQLEQAINHKQSFEQDISKDLKRLMIRCTHLQDKLLLTIDDITYQVSAQKQAAWKDVARVIAHEIKNPLTPTRLCAEQLLDALKTDTPLSVEKQKKYLNTIVQNVEHVNKLINNFTAFAKQSQQTLQLQEFDLYKLMEEVIDTAKLGHDDIQFSLKCKVNSIIKADRQQIFQAILNLTQNAIQAFDSNIKNKQIQLVCTISKNQCKIKIIDNGSGIPIENIEKLFQPYMTTKSYGTGLGLVIVRKIAQAHDGNVTLENNPDHGATATFFIPID